MRGVLADNDIQGQFRILLGILEGTQWREIWMGLNLTIESFDTLGLARSASDAAIWKVCQERRIVLLTANRRQETPDSLGEMIRNHNTPTSLPAFTLANAQRILVDKTYAARVAERFLEYLLDIDNHRGTGRLYIP